MTKPIEIDVLWHTDQTKALEASDVDYDLTDLDTRKVYFLHIDHIIPYDWGNDIWFCRIHSGGEKFICPQSYEEVKKLING